LVNHCISAFIYVLDQKTLFNHIPTLLHSNLATSSIFFIDMEVLWHKKNNFIWQKVHIYIEMVQSGSILHKKKDWWYVEIRVFHKTEPPITNQINNSHIFCSTKRQNKYLKKGQWNNWSYFFPTLLVNSKIMDPWQ